MGYVVSLRNGNTGIGYTLETLLGLEENNLKTPDFGDIELKSQRNGVNNRGNHVYFQSWGLESKTEGSD